MGSSVWCSKCLIDRTIRQSFQARWYWSTRSWSFKSTCSETDKTTKSLQKKTWTFLKGIRQHFNILMGICYGDVCVWNASRRGWCLAHFCWEALSNDVRGELWIKCLLCEWWCHTLCTGCENQHYICDFRKWTFHKNAQFLSLCVIFAMYNKFPFWY